MASRTRTYLVDRIIRAKLTENSIIGGGGDDMGGGFTERVGDYLEGGRFIRAYLIAMNAIMVFASGAMSAIFGFWLAHPSEDVALLFAAVGPLSVAGLAWSQSNLRWTVRHFLDPRSTVAEHDEHWRW